MLWLYPIFGHAKFVAYYVTTNVIGYSVVIAINKVTCSNFKLCLDLSRVAFEYHLAKLI